MKNRNINIILKSAVFFILAFIARDVFCSNTQDNSGIKENIACNIEYGSGSQAEQIDQMNAEIEKLKYENNELRSRQDVQTAGINPGIISISLILMFSALTGVISVTVAKRRTRSLCHCNNRRIKLMKQNMAKSNLQQ